MSNNRFVWDGLEELRQELRNLPPELQAEGGEIIVDSAESAADEIREAYPVRTGNLKARVRVKKTANSVSTTVVVSNTAKHAYIFENGTEARHTDLGANRGSMPPGHVFIPAVMKHRRRMYDRLKDLIARKGLEVSGEP